MDVLLLINNNSWLSLLKENNQTQKFTKITKCCNEGLMGLSHELGCEINVNHKRYKV